MGYFIFGFATGFIIAVVLGYFFLEKIPWAGKMIKYQADLKIGLEEPKDFSRGHGLRKRD